MATKILLTMPQPGETITEGNVVRWIVAPGAVVKEGQAIVELETEKAVFEYESPYEGKLAEIIASDGSTVAVGNPIAVFEVEDSKASTYFMLGIGKPASAPSPSAFAKASADRRPSPARGEGVSRKGSAKRIPSPLPVLSGVEGRGEGKGEGEKKLSPLVRHLIQEYDIDISELDRVKGTGPGGRITKENILQYLESRKKPSGTKEAEAAGLAEGDIVPFSPVRMRIAEHMVRSKATIPHAHTTLSIDMTRVVEYRKKSKGAFEKQYGISLGILPLIFPALRKGIRAYPVVNASLREASLRDEGGKKVLVLHRRINLGVAVDTERGLYIPVIPNAQDKGYVDLARDLESLIQKARANKLTPAELTGMTFTFNNYGYYGTTHGVQIILPPQSITLGMGVIEKRPWVVGDQIQVRYVAEFTVAFDHRIIDGRDAGLFLSSLKKSLEGFSDDDLM